jgi:glutathione S-transferase
MVGENRSPEYLKMNPQGLIPCIVDNNSDGFVLSESTAILKYICNTQKSVPEHFWPKDEKQRALTDQFLEFYSFHFRPAMIGPLRLRMGKMFRGAEYSEDIMNMAMQNLWSALDTLELYLG